MDRRNELIKQYLEQESSGYPIEKMPSGMIRQLCQDFEVRESEIVGFFEDVMQLGGALFASFRNRYNTRGILFLEDKFIYNKGFPYGKFEMPYESIRFVERNLASTVIYTGEIKEDGTKETLKLSGISFEESQPISRLMEELRNLNEDTIEVTKMEKYLDKGKKVLNTVVDMVVSSALDTANKAEGELHKKEQKAREILNNQGNYTQEQVEKAKEFLSEHSDNEEKLRNARGFAVDMHNTIHAEKKSAKVQHAERKNEAFDNNIQYQDEDSSDAE